MNDIIKVFHHPALRNEGLQLHRDMFNTVRKWVDEQPDRHNLNNILSSESVKAGHNHKGGSNSRDMHDHTALGGHGKTSGSIWSEIQSRDLGSMEGKDGNPQSSYLNPSPQPDSPITHQNPDYGYEGTNQGRPHSSQGGYLSPGPQQGGNYQAPPPTQSYHQEPYGGGYQQPPYGQQPDYGGGYQQPYGQGPPPGYGQPPYGQGPPPPGQWGQGPPPPPGGPWGPPPPNFQGGPPPGQYQGYPGQGYPGQGYPGQGYPGQGYGGGGGGYRGY